MSLPEFPIRVGKSPVHGEGVFATRVITEGDLIERCPYFVIDQSDLGESTRLGDYLFACPGHPGDFMCVMGYGMVYNHSDEPNAEWRLGDDESLRFIALRAIEEGEEIFQNYGPDYWTTRSEDEDDVSS